MIVAIFSRLGGFTIPGELQKPVALGTLNGRIRSERYLNNFKRAVLHG